MIVLGKWRWPVTIGLPVAVGTALFLSGVVRFAYEGDALLAYSGLRGGFDGDLRLFTAHSNANVSLEKSAGQPARSLHAEGPSPVEVCSRLESAAHAYAQLSLEEHRKRLGSVRDGFEHVIAAFGNQGKAMEQERKASAGGTKRIVPRAQISAKIQELTARRRFLIDHYPSHTDIPLLAKQIQDLKRQPDRPAKASSEKMGDLGRRIQEAKVRHDYFVRRLAETETKTRALKPTWKIIGSIQKPQWPKKVEGWPVGAGVVAGVFVLACFIFRSERRGITKVQMPASAVSRVADEPVALEVVSPEVPSDPLTEKAAALYSKWTLLAQTLYTPAPQPPDGLLEQVGPLLQESSDFLPEGHDVLARYLARVTTSGDLPSHVARTVLMTLTGAQEAGVTPEHRLAMALAALFHDLAVVSRPPGVQEEVGSEVGRLSASVISRIPGLTPALLSMVEDILVGMDEYKMDTWQNVSQSLMLEPLSKVLREIDRFEKIMQRQKTRLDKRIANQ